MHFTKRIFLLTVLMMAFGVMGVGAQKDVKKVLMPIGGGYGDTYDAFIAAALNSKVGDPLKIVVLPSTYATNADEITAEERQENLDAAENRRSQIEEACTAGVPEDVTCDVQLTPIFTRDDTLDAMNLAYFTDDVGAVYILGGDQTIAMQVMANTPVEEALTKAYERGALIAGTSAGEAVQSRVMIGGYLGDFGPETGLNEGAVDIWNEGDKRGLPFGITSAILEQHFWERARLGRLMNVLAQPGVPGVGIAVDSYTAATITDGKTLSNVAGLYSV
ncbi:MAG: cyanophycinase, partial [Anaerolineae bacterium]|nr:cyanophycinase [Anaerolineae bacterium]